MDEGYRLLGCRGCGSAIVAAGFEMAGIPYTMEHLESEVPGPDRDRVLALNPLGQVPTLVLPDGSVMTESAAIMLMLGDLAPDSGLVPPAGTDVRNLFLRWLIFLVAAMYPNSTFGDQPERWLPGAAEAGPALRSATDERKKELWLQVAAGLGDGPWFLGRQFTALDIYVAVMVHWRPGRQWFASHAPALDRIATAAHELPALRDLFAREFPSA